MTTYLFGKALFIRFTVRVLRERLSICVCASFLLALRIWDLIVLVPDYCLSCYYFVHVI